MKVGKGLRAQRRETDEPMVVMQAVRPVEEKPRVLRVLRGEASG